MNIERYMTKGIQERIPLELQMVLWELQTKIRCEQTKIDYLQVYELKINKGKEEGSQFVIHRTQEPRYKVNYSIQIKVPIEDKIFIIEDCYEDKIVETMLLAEEY